MTKLQMIRYKTWNFKTNYSRAKEKFMRCMGFLMNENDKILISAYLDGETSPDDESKYVESLLRYIVNDSK